MTNRRDARIHPLLIALLCALALGAHTAKSSAHSAPPVPNWPPKTFPITFWCGPPEPYITGEQYREIAAAGFTVVMPPCEGAATPERNRKILDTARGAGLKAVINDSRMPLSITGNATALANLKAIVKDYGRNPALLGYFLTDEPGARAFAGLGEVAAELKKLDPGHLVYINLLPSYATSDLNTIPSQLQTDTYARYLDQYMQTVKPDVLSWDFYSFLAQGDRPGFYGNLYAAQRAVESTQPATPFWQVVLSVQHGSYRALTEAELRYEAMQTLAFGGSGLVYFTYWTPNDPSFQWSNGIRNRDGTPGPLYEPVKRVNTEVKTITKYLYGALRVGTYQSGDIPQDARASDNDLPVHVTGPGNLTIGFFRGGGGYIYVIAANRDYKNQVDAALGLNSGKRDVEALDLRTGKWTKTGKIGPDGDTAVTAAIAPGGAVLLRWQ